MPTISDVSWGYADGVLRAEFTVEPFVEGQPGPHVRAAIEAVEALGFSVEFGPFASEFTGEADAVSRAVAALVRDAYEHGATRVSIQVELMQDEFHRDEIVKGDLSSGSGA